MSFRLRGIWSMFSTNFAPICAPPASKTCCSITGKTTSIASLQPSCKLKAEKVSNHLLNKLVDTADRETNSEPTLDSHIQVAKKKLNSTWIQMRCCFSNWKLKFCTVSNQHFEVFEVKVPGLNWQNMTSRIKHNLKFMMFQAKQIQGKWDDLLIRAWQGCFLKLDREKVHVCLKSYVRV